MINEDQIACTHVTKTLAKWIDPEMIGEFGITHSDVAGNTFTETEAPEDAQRPGEFRFSVCAFFLNCLKRGGEVDSDLLRGEGNAVDCAVLSAGHVASLRRI